MGGKGGGGEGFFPIVGMNTFDSVPNLNWDQ